MCYFFCANYRTVLLVILIKHYLTQINFCFLSRELDVETLYNELHLKFMWYKYNTNYYKCRFKARDLSE